jgi:hypothetical protein
MKELARESGLGGLIGNAHHGVGILPVCNSHLTLGKYPSGS